MRCVFQVTGLLIGGFEFLRDHYDYLLRLEAGNRSMSSISSLSAGDGAEDAVEICWNLGWGMCLRSQPTSDAMWGSNAVQQTCDR